MMFGMCILTLKFFCIICTILSVCVYRMHPTFDATATIECNFLHIHISTRVCVIRLNIQFCLVNSGFDFGIWFCLRNGWAWAQIMILWHMLRVPSLTTRIQFRLYAMALKCSTSVEPDKMYQVSSILVTQNRFQSPPLVRMIIFLLVLFIFFSPNVCAICLANLIMSNYLLMLLLLGFFCCFLYEEDQFKWIL